MYVQCIRTALEFFSAGEGSSLHGKKSLSQLTGGETINGKRKGHGTRLYILHVEILNINVQYTSKKPPRERELISNQAKKAALAEKIFIALLG